VRKRSVSYGWSTAQHFVRKDKAFHGTWTLMTKDCRLLCLWNC